jgi:hypothetical protein
MGVVRFAGVARTISAMHGLTMAKPTKTVEIGSEVTLPSGKQVRITAPADIRRPWQAVESGHVWQVCRPPGQPYTGAASFYFGGKRTPLQFDEDDAKALTEMLNSVRPGKYPS